jgi:hypothetical protein
VGVFGESVDDGEDRRLAADARKSLHEIHQDVRPHGVGDLYGLEQAGGWRCSVLLH